MRLKYLFIFQLIIKIVFLLISYELCWTGDGDKLGLTNSNYIAFIGEYTTTGNISLCNVIIYFVMQRCNKILNVIKHAEIERISGADLVLHLKQYRKLESRRG